MSSGRTLLIVNPASGRLGGAAALRRFVAAVEDALGDVDIEATERRGHAIELARSGAAEGRPAIVAVGGDGTLNEVVNGVLEARPPGDARRAPDTPRVGLIGLGTGGDFGISLGIRRDLDGFLGALTAGKTKPVDVVRATFAGHDGGPVERHFVNVLSAGPGGLVDTYVARFPRALGGRLAYAGASLLAVAECPRAAVRLRTWPAPGGPPAERELSAHLVAVCNGSAFGGGMRMAPMALPDDGLLDVVTIAVRSKWTIVRNISKVYRGRHLEVPGVEHVRCRSVEIELLDDRAAERFALDVDGEALGRLPLRAEIVPGALEMFAP